MKTAPRKSSISILVATGVVAGLGVGLPPGVASADPVGSVFTYTASAGSSTSSILLGVDDTLYASGFTPSNFGSPIVVGIPALDDSATANVASLPLSGISTGANGIAQGPASGPYANTILVSSDDETSGVCGAGTASRIQAFRADTWALVQTWNLPIGKCPSAMVLGPDGRLWFDQLYKNEVGRLNLDDSSTAFLAFPGGGSPNAQGRLGVSGGNIYFPALGTASGSSPSSLLIVGTGTGGTTLDDTQLVGLPGPNGSLVYDLHVASNGDVWVPMRSPNILVVYRPGVGDDTFVARSATLNTGSVKSVTQASDGTIWVASTDGSSSKYSAFANAFTPDADPSAINLTPIRDFTVAGFPTYGGYITAGPAGQDTLYRTTATNTVQRIGLSTVPPPPVLAAATGGPGSITLQWSYPGTGGSPITDVEYAMSSSPTSWVSLGTTTTPATITLDNAGNALAPGQAYTVFIRARNAVGPSNDSNALTATPTDPTPPPTYPPAPPTDVVAVAGDLSASVSWTPPVNGGSFAITNYRVVASPGGTSCLASAPAQSCDVAGLTNGEPYTFTVQALNGAGWGTMSEPSNAVTPIGPKPTPSIMVSGSRGTESNAGRVFADGVTTNLVGRQVQARVHLSGEMKYENGSMRTVASDGTFTWQRRTKKTVYVYFRVADEPGVRSNRLVIRLNRP